MRKDLFDLTDYRVIPVEMALRCGVNQAMFMNRLDFYMRHVKEFGFERDGHRWARFTFEQWHEQFPFWSLRTVKTVVIQCVAEGWVFSIKAEPGWKQAKAYRVNTQHEIFSIVQELHDGHGAEIAPSQSADIALCSINEKTDEKTGSPSVDVVLPLTGFDREHELQMVRSNPSHGPTLAKFWRRCMREYGHASATQPAMKVKDQKMLKDMLKLLPEGGERMLLNVLENYALFVNFAREGYNVNMAARPQVQKLMLVVDGIAEFEAPMINDDVDYSNLGLKGLFDNGDSTTDDA